MKPVLKKKQSKEIIQNIQSHCEVNNSNSNTNTDATNTEPSSIRKSIKVPKLLNVTPLWVKVRGITTITTHIKLIVNVIQLHIALSAITLLAIHLKPSNVLQGTDLESLCKLHKNAYRVRQSIHHATADCKQTTMDSFQNCHKAIIDHE